MKKKVCNWLDSNQWGGIQLLSNKVYPCCLTGKPIIDKDDLDYSTLTKEDFQNARKALFESINDGTNESCKGCLQLIEKEENEIDIGPISYLSLGPFSTCNLRCKYCYFTHEQLGEKLEEKHTKIFPVVKNFHENGLLKQDVNLGLAGGEPLLIDDIPETLELLAQNYKNPSFTFLSNSSLTNKAEILTPKFSKLPKNLNKALYTSIDAGTPETYKKIRGRDLYYNTVNNILNYAKQGSFDEFLLKYILMLDHSNTSDEDIFGFLNMVKLIDQSHSKRTVVIIDRDMMVKQNECVDDEIIAAAGKIYYTAGKILNIDIAFYGGALRNNSERGRKDIKRLKEFAANYESKEKTAQEKYYLSLLSTKNKKNSKRTITALLDLSTKTKKNIKKLIDDNKGKKICLYGAGAFAGKFLEKFDLSELNILGIIDKDEKKRGTEICGYKIYSVDEIETLNPDVLVLTVFEPKYCLPFLEKLKLDKNYNFKIIDNLFEN